jgi:hypothetical protein
VFGARVSARDRDGHAGAERYVLITIVGVVSWAAFLLNAWGKAPVQLRPVTF